MSGMLPEPFGEAIELDDATRRNKATVCPSIGLHKTPPVHNHLSEAFSSRDDDKQIPIRDAASRKLLKSITDFGRAPRKSKSNSNAREGVISFRDSPCMIINK